MFHRDLKHFEFQDVNNAEILQTAPAVDVSILNSLGIGDIEYFKKIFDQLCRTWWGNITAISDCEGKRLVQCTLLKDMRNYLYISIIADDLKLFNKYCEDKDRILAFELCCLCGAEKIIRDLLNKDNSYLLKSENAIAYLLSSGKLEFTLELARVAKELGRSDPGPVLSYSVNNFFFSQKILDIFEQSSKGLSKFTPQLLKHQQKKVSCVKRKAEEALDSSPMLVDFIKGVDKQQLEILYITIAEYHSKLQLTQKTTDKLTPKFS